MKTWKCSICLTDHPVSKRTCDSCNTCFGRLDYNEMLYCRKCKIKYRKNVMRCKACGCQLARRSWTSPLRPSMMRRSKRTKEYILANSKSTYKAVMLQ